MSEDFVLDPGRATRLLDGFSRLRVLVVGDMYLDENVFGTVTGVSLEAPIPIFEIGERRYNPGAAGNAACNVAALGARTRVVGVVGTDTNADILRKEFEKRGVDASGLVVDDARPTNCYGKLRSGGFNIPGQEILRTDTPTPPFISGRVEDAVVAAIEKCAAEVDAIIVTDQVCSVVTAPVLEAVVACGEKHDLLTVGDSRERVGEFAGFRVVVPNDREAALGAGLIEDADATVFDAGEALLKVAERAFVTRGPAGISVFEAGEDVVTLPTLATTVEDVTGAGDTVTAAVTATLAAGGTSAEAAWIGNAAAALAVAQTGVVTVPRDDLARYLAGGTDSAKVRTVEQLREILPELQRAGRKVVWTNGCFDILHAGHVTYLQRAAREGDVLIVGLNSDASVQAVKGPDRPIVPEDERALIISALECVGYVTIFSDASPAPLLEALKPDVYTKGGDYTIDTINQEERGIVEGYGGRIALLAGVDGRSTTNLVSKLSREYED